MREQSIRHLSPFEEWSCYETIWSLAYMRPALYSGLSECYGCLPSEIYQAMALHDRSLGKTREKVEEFILPSAGDFSLSIGGSFNFPKCMGKIGFFYYKGNLEILGLEKPVFMTLPVIMAVPGKTGLSISRAPLYRYFNNPFDSGRVFRELRESLESAFTGFL